MTGICSTWTLYALTSELPHMGKCVLQSIG